MVFTGIVQGVGIIIDIQKFFDNATQTNWVKLSKERLGNLPIGSSIANNDCYLSIVAIQR